MTHAEREHTQRLCELFGALACAVTAAFALAAFPVGNQHLWNAEFFVSSMLALCSYLAAFGLLDRASAYFFGPLDEFRLNWLLIPFLGTAIYTLNYNWYFSYWSVIAESWQTLALIALFGGTPLIGVMFAFWLAGVAYRALMKP